MKSHLKILLILTILIISIIYYFIIYCAPLLEENTGYDEKFNENILIKYWTASGSYTEGSRSIDYSTNWAPITGWFTIFIPIIFQFFVVILLIKNYLSTLIRNV